jgi:hypothetical protein
VHQDPTSPPPQDADAQASGLIDALGGTVAAARLFEVTPQAVTQWRRAGIPKPRLMFLRVARPELFSTIREVARAA